jgi:hypothetical protein
MTFLRQCWPCTKAHISGMFASWYYSSTYVTPAGISCITQRPLILKFYCCGFNFETVTLLFMSMGQDCFSELWCLTGVLFIT